MPRPPRLQLEHGSYYAVQNGALERAVFTSEQDFAAFEHLLATLVREEVIELHAYCLLPDHFHLLLTLRQGTLATAMQRLTARYARYAQRSSGHFFRHRYRAVLIEPEEYLGPLVRYLHYLPVHTGLATHPDDYPHSSHDVYRRARTVSWVSQRRLTTQLERADERYTDWIASPPTADEIDTFSSRRVRALASTAFLEQLPRRAPIARPRAFTMEHIIHDVALALEVSVAELTSRSRAQPVVLARALIAWLVVEHKLGTLSDIARRLNRDVSTISKAIVRYRKHRPDLFRLDVLHHFRPLAVR